MEKVKNKKSHRSNMKNYTIRKYCFKLYKTILKTKFSLGQKFPSLQLKKIFT